MDMFVHFSRDPWGTPLTSAMYFALIIYVAFVIVYTLKAAPNYRLLVIGLLVVSLAAFSILGLIASLIAVLAIKPKNDYRLGEYRKFLYLIWIIGVITPPVYIFLSILRLF